jgi:fructokinase
MVQIGIDFGGTKIEAAALDDQGRILSRKRVPNPGGYGAAIHEVHALVLVVKKEAGGSRIAARRQRSGSARRGRSRRAPG